MRLIQDAVAMLEAGADKVGVNTAAVQRPEIIGELAALVGSQCVVLSIDAARDRQSAGRTWHVVTHAGTQRTQRDAIEWAQTGARLGAGEILLTSFDRDGTNSGYDLELIGAMSERVRVPIIASGGAGSAADMLSALQAGADAVLAASIFHDGVTTVRDVKQVLTGAGVEIRS